MTVSEVVTCAGCGKDARAPGSGTPGYCGGTGYGTTPEGATYCYACIGERDAATLKGAAAGPVMGPWYLIPGKDGARSEVTNWPGTLRARVYMERESFHNFAGPKGRRDAWFMFAGKRFHAVSIGWGQLARVRCLK